MNAWKRIAAAALGGLLLLPIASAAAGVKRPRPNDVPAAPTAIAPNELQLYNDYASPERTYASRSVVVHYVVLGIDAPPLNDDDRDAVPDYVERVGEAADRALAYYAARGFHAPLPDTGGSDALPDLYVSRFAPGTLGVALPSGRAEGGAFAVIANNLDPSAGRSFASLHATVAHELFHLVQFSYFGPEADPPIPTWILEGSAAALEGRVNGELDDLVTTIQLRRWLSAADRGLTGQSYGAQLFWRYFDSAEPGFLPALLDRLAAGPVVGEGESVVRSTYEDAAGTPFAPAFHAFALSVAAEHVDELEPAVVAPRAVSTPLAIHYLALPRVASPVVAFPRGRRGAAASVSYELESDVPGRPSRFGHLAPRATDGGRTLSFAVPPAVLRSPRLASLLLVVSNAGPGPVAYTVAVR
jgi:hypothetical protein